METELDRERLIHSTEPRRLVRASPVAFALSVAGLSIQAIFAALLVAQVDINWSYLVPTRIAYDANTPANIAGLSVYSILVVLVLAVGFYGSWRLRSNRISRIRIGAALVFAASVTLVFISDLSTSFFVGSRKESFSAG